ncbi:ribonuclease III domain-containing protein, partial [Staphylococcus pasteuri]|uniref:ribonuclease III domain-containing protein n=1 Tax=Staphylococcus pasteuri TaxID=45972 RepID=UPI0012B7D126
MPHPVLHHHVPQYILLKLPTKPNPLHQLSKQYLSPKTQPQTLQTLIHQHSFTQQQLHILKTPPNPKTYTNPKNTHIQTYPNTSPIQALLPYFYLQHNQQPLKEFLNKII